MASHSTLVTSPLLPRYPLSSLNLFPSLPLLSFRCTSYFALRKTPFFPSRAILFRPFATFSPSVLPLHCVPVVYGSRLMRSVVSASRMDSLLCLFVFLSPNLAKFEYSFEYFFASPILPFERSTSRSLSLTKRKL